VLGHVRKDFPGRITLKTKSNIIATGIGNPIPDRAFLRDTAGQGRSSLGSPGGRGARYAQEKQSNVLLFVKMYLL